MDTQLKKGVLEMCNQVDLLVGLDKKVNKKGQKTRSLLPNAIFLPAAAITAIKLESCSSFSVIIIIVISITVANTHNIISISVSPAMIPIAVDNTCDIICVTISVAASTAPSTVNT